MRLHVANPIPAARRNDEQLWQKILRQSGRGDDGAVGYGNNGDVALVTDGDNGNPCLAVCLNGQWRRVSIGSAIWNVDRHRSGRVIGEQGTDEWDDRHQRSLRSHSAKVRRG